MEYEDPRSRCCCNVHVQRAATIIGGVGIILALAGIVLASINGHFYSLIPLGIAIVLYISVIYAQYARNATAYWPYLILNGFSIAVCSLYMLLLIAMFLTMPVFWQRHLNDLTNYKYQDAISRLPRVMTAILTFGVFLIQGVNIWFELIIYNAYCFLLREQHGSAPYKA